MTTPSSDIVERLRDSPSFKDATEAADEIERLRGERDALGQALGGLAVKAGIYNDMPMTGPQVVMAADDLYDYIKSLRGDK